MGFRQNRQLESVSLECNLVGYFRAGQFDEVLWRYVDLRRWSIGLDSGTITFGLKSCIELGDLGFGPGIHGDALKSGFSSNGFVGSSPNGFYSRCGFSGDQRACEAFGFACRMQRQGLHPNRVTLASLLQAASQLEALEEGRSVHGYAIRRGIGGSDEVFETSLLDLLAATALVDLYSKSHKLIQSRELCDRMEKKDAISYDVMMTGYLHNNYASEAVDTFVEMAGVSTDMYQRACEAFGFARHMQRQGLHPNRVTLVSLLQAALQLKEELVVWMKCSKQVLWTCITNMNPLEWQPALLAKWIERLLVLGM
ncbi:pentatricopeptide repeat-containing protein [Pyrus ussuriensis x Pyrus communis]|uniref:Pentatricopeptide repeat-containing protein n=1 Tax=Pyrus ussuriensis x Pyrus communis TaxID=2448454 RepID=A0A5N5HZ17_9ROSA|nr:pentatricopeptide repeat-containing protein [Pyrus ussuriensis x Pyrus communis]